MRKNSKKMFCLCLALTLATACQKKTSSVDLFMEKQSKTKEEVSVSELPDPADENGEEDSAKKDETVETSKEETKKKDNSDKIDLDLTKESDTILYASIYAIASAPQDYEGKRVKINGAFTSFEFENGQMGFACIVSDATACCSQGMEFVLDGHYNYPEDYPKEGEEITISGVFSPYEEDGNNYCRLIHAKLEE